MKKRASTATLTAAKYLVLAVLGASLVGQGLLAPSVNASQLPESCQDILASNPGAPDGDYTIFPNSNTEVFTVFCAGMGTGAPKEYLSLFNIGGAFNFAQFGGESVTPPAVVVTTYYTKIRLDPVTLLVDVGDETFASSTGSDCCIGPRVITSVAYGTASDCLAPFSDAGRGNIDLTGTPFGVNATFGIDGYLPAGSVNGQVGTIVTEFPVTGQVVNLTGGGYCGATFPLPRRPFVFPPVNGTGGFILQLQYLGQPSTVVIGGCDAGVPNVLLPGGGTITDRILQCAAGARNHGAFVRCVSHVTDDLKKAGIITGAQEGAIQRCAGQAPIP